MSVSTQGLAAYSLVTFRNSQGESARGTLLKLTRSTVVFEMYTPYSITQLSEVLQDLTLWNKERIIYKGKGVVSNLVNTGLVQIASVTLIDGWQDLSLFQGYNENLSDEVVKYISEWDSINYIEPSYKLIVADIRVFLSDTSKWLEQIDLLVKTSHEQKESALIPEQFDALVMPLINKLDNLLMEFENEAEKITAEDVDRHKAFAQRDITPLMMCAPFFYRAYIKPLGYAGDYEMVNMMFRTGQIGSNSYAQFINKYFTLIGPTKAHRNRIEILIEKLKDTAINAASKDNIASILDIGCGPSLEIQQFIRMFPVAERCSFTLLDFNKETIEFAERKISEAIQESKRNVKCVFIEKSVHKLLKECQGGSDATEIDKYDFVYCAGLFDYLSDRTCSKLLRLFYRWTKPGGQIIATNVTSDNPSKWTMDHIVEWHLIHRNDNDMERLAPNMGKQSIYFDSTKYNVFLEIEKPVVN